MYIRAISLDEYFCKVRRLMIDGWLEFLQTAALSVDYFFNSLDDTFQNHRDTQREFHTRNKRRRNSSLFRFSSVSLRWLTRGIAQCQFVSVSICHWLVTTRSHKSSWFLPGITEIQRSEASLIWLNGTVNETREEQSRDFNCLSCGWERVTEQPSITDHRLQVDNPKRVLMSQTKRHVLYH